MLGRPLLIEAVGFVRRGWVQHAAAVDATGVEVDPWDRDAVAWSLLGALVAALQRRERKPGDPLAVSELMAACAHLINDVDDDSLQEWNDALGRSQSEVVAVLERAIVDPYTDTSAN